MNIESIQEIVLVRHAEPEWVRDGLNIDEPPLSDRGRAQAELLADRLSGEVFDEILVSPLLRTRQTAEPLLQATGHGTVIEPWLEEIRNPIWHGTPVEKAAEAWREMKRLPSAQRWSGLDGGEAVSEFVQRINIGCSLFLEERGIRRADTDLPVWTLGPEFVPHRRVCLVAHAGTNSVSLCHMLGLQPTPWEWERFVIGHASVSRIQLFEIGDGATFSMVKLSDNEHLPEGLRTY
jgi:probable phosphoglycerate mutase